MPVLKIRNSDGSWQEVFGGSGSSANITVNGQGIDENGNITLDKSDVGIYTSSSEPVGAKDGDIWIDDDVVGDGDASSMIPEYTEDDYGKVLSVTSNGLIWVAMSGGGAVAELPNVMEASF